MAIKGITYDNQGPSAAAHAEFFASTHSDGILNGCALSYLGDTLTIAAGRLVSAGRLSELQAAETITISAVSGVARVLLQTDLSQEATRTSFKQLSFVVQTADSAAALPALVQEDINSGSGVIFQSEICTLQLGSSGIEAILSRMPSSAPIVRDGSISLDALAPEVEELSFRPNLLDNWYFVRPVNQRGFSSETGRSGYFIDRWKKSVYDTTTVSVGSGVTLDNSATDGTSSIRQIRETVLPGGTYALSVCLAECSGTCRISVDNAAEDTASAVIASKTITTAGVHSLTVTSGSIKQVRISALAGAKIRIIAVKLELGSTQTLTRQNASGGWALNEIPNYGLQLEICRRYYQRIRTYGTYALPLAFGHMASTTAGRVALPLPTPLRDVPTMTASGVKFAVKSISSSVTLTATPTVFLALGNIIHLSFTLPEAVNANAVATLCYYGADESTHYIELSADL